MADVREGVTEISTGDFDFERLFAHLPASFYVLDETLRFAHMNDAYLRDVNRARDDLLGRYVFDAFPETGERLRLFKEGLERALAGESNDVLRQRYTMQVSDDPADGVRERWWTSHNVAMHDRDGRCCGVLVQAMDVTKEVEAERMRDIVLRELDHRMKNQLATIAAIARRTAHDATTTDEFLESFDRRLQAMARTHQMLVDGQWSGLLLGDLIRTELAPYRDGGDTRIRVEGPPITLSPAEAQSLGLALHELATNAAKYGGLGEHGQSLDVSWHDGEDRVELTWTERARQAIVPPSRRGFGSIIVDRLLPSQIGASVQRDYRADGLHCRIAIPREAAAA